MKKIYIIAAVMALLSGILLYLYLQDLEAHVSGEPEIPTVGTIVTIAEEIPPHTAIPAESLQLISMPVEYIPEGAVTEITQAAGLVSDGTLYPGEILLAAMLGTEAEKADCLSYVIPEGMRAITIGVDTVTGTAGYITAGDRVDLLLYTSGETVFTLNQESTQEGQTASGSQAFTYIAGDSLEVLAVGELTYTGVTSYTNITLAATPEQCREIYAADCLANYDGGGYGLMVLLRRREDLSPLPHAWIEADISMHWAEQD